jgi:penicillin-binding protein 2
MGDSWYPGDTINMAIGQGPLWVSPMQMALMITTVANKGTIYKPYIVQKIVDGNDDKVVFAGAPKKIGTVNLSKNTWDLLYTGLVTTVKEGTGHACSFDSLSVAGKTGTAQSSRGQDHAWFVAFAPVENPQLALAVLVENGGSGSTVAGPVAREIFSAAFKLNEHRKLELNNAEEIRN